MTNELQRRRADIVKHEPAHAPGPAVVVYSQHWLDALGRLHPAAQIALAVGLGAGVPFALVAVASAAGGLVAGLATFALAAMTIFSQLALTVGAGVGILILVIVGVVGILKL